MHRKSQHTFVAQIIRCGLIGAALVLPLACSEPETSKALVKIANVKVFRSGTQTLNVTFDYDLEKGVSLPLPYKEVLVFPLDPKIKLGGTIEPFVLHVGSVAVSLEIPPNAGIDWNSLNKDTCCIVSLKGVIEQSGKKDPTYERISNEMRVLPPR